MRLPALLLALLLALPALALAACGGDEPDARALLRATFGEAPPVRSGRVDLRLRIDAEGVPQLGRGVRLGLAGPFETRGEGRMPRFDLDLTLGSGDAALRAGAISTGDRAWLKLQGQAYTLSREIFDRLARSGAGDKKDAGGLSLRSLGVDPQAWLDDPEALGPEDLDGARTEHVRGTVDVPRLLEDVSRLVERAGALGVAGAPETPAKLTPEQRETVAASIERATVDVWTGADDRRLRRLKVDVRFDVPEDRRAEGAGPQRGTVAFDLRLSALDRRQPIAAPRDARPFSDLQAGLAAIAAALQQQREPEAGAAPQAPQPEPGATPQPEPGSYADCLAQAAGDLRAQQACADLLGG